MVNVCIDSLHRGAIFRLVMRVFKARRIRGHFELGRMIVEYIKDERACTWSHVHFDQMAEYESQPICSAVSCKDLLAVGTEDGYLSLWDMKKKRPDHVRVSVSKYGRVYFMSFSKSGKRLLMGDEQDLLIWDVSSYPFVYQLHRINLQGSTWGGFVLDDNTFLVRMGSLLITYRLAPGDKIHRLPHTIGDMNVFQIGVAPNGTDYFIISFGSLRLYEISNALISVELDLKPWPAKCPLVPRIRLWHDGEGGSECGAFSPNSEILATSSSRYVIRTFRVSTGEMLFQYDKIAGLGAARINFFFGYNIVVSGNMFWAVLDYKLEHYQRMDSKVLRAKIQPYSQGLVMINTMRLKHSPTNYSLIDHDGGVVARMIRVQKEPKRQRGRGRIMGYEPEGMALLFAD